MNRPRPRVEVVGDVVWGPALPGDHVALLAALFGPAPDDQPGDRPATEPTTGPAPLRLVHDDTRNLAPTAGGSTPRPARGTRRSRGDAA